MATTPTAPGKGLEGVTAANSGVCWIDGEQGVLAYRGIDIHELAEHSTFEETAYLLINGNLPSKQELEKYKRDLARGARDPSRRDRISAAYAERYQAHGGAAHGGFRALRL